MGKGIMIVVIASLLTIGSINSSDNETEIQAQLVRTEYEDQILARELAHSAFNLVVANASRDFSGFREDVNDVAYGDGEFAYSAVGDAQGPIALVAYGNVGSAVHRIDATLEKTGDPLLDAITFDGPFSSVTANGNSFLISGMNTPVEEGEEAGIAADGHAIRTTLDESQEQLLSEIDADQIVGILGEGDVVSGAPNIDLDALQDSILVHPDLITLEGNQRFNGSDSFGSRENPALVSIDGDVRINGNVSGFGVLMVNGSLKAAGTLQWEGLVIVNSSGGEAEFKGTVDIFGALVMRSLTPSGESGGYVDAGLAGGHLDVDVFGSGNSMEHHEHQYDDQHDTNQIDFLKDDCGVDGGLCWKDKVGDAGYTSVRMELLGTDNTEGNLHFETSTLLVEGRIDEGFNREASVADIDAFTLTFTEICDLNGSSPEAVQGDSNARDGMLTLQVFDATADEDALPIHEVTVYRHSDAASCTGNSDPDRVDVQPQSFYINGNVGIYRSESALNNVVDLLPAMQAAPVEITLSSMRHVANQPLEM